MPGNPNPSPETRWKPGQSGNPAGKPPGAGVSLVALLRRKLEECPEGTDKKTYAQLLVDRAMGIALKGGDVSMIRDLMDRIDGKPASSLDVTTGGDKLTEYRITRGEEPKV